MEQAQQEFRQDPSGANLAEFFRQNFPDQKGFEQVAAEMTKNPNDREYISSANTALDAVVEQSYKSGMLGASGALFGLLFAFAYLFPNTELFLLFIPFPIKAKYFVFMYAAYEPVRRRTSHTRRQRGPFCPPRWPRDRVLRS
ncbi:hypothetical protein ACFQT0_23620 [Hymenobacter humi]|uniref:Uncharacterized protein n=1 Tax=Hymenobacter humi TaxID=1411620 RepID=A0ABW2U943_9BACT